MKRKRLYRRLLGVKLVALLAVVAVLAAACGGGGEEKGAEKASTVPGASTNQTGLQAVIISSDLAVGPNRFMVGLLQDSQAVTDAQTKFEFFKLRGNQGELRFQGEATVIKMMRGIVREKPDGTRETLKAGEIAAYTASVDFNEPGDWGVRVTASRAGRTLDPLAVQFTVQEKSRSIAIGQTTPKSRQLTLADAAELSKIDTANPPDPDWHRITIADAVALGKPVAIAFTTPGFCESQMCAPMTQELGQLYDKYKDRVTFIHIEPYLLDKARSGQGLVPVPVMEEWGLRTEPWIFVVDGQGKVAAKFEAFVMMEEIEAALKAALGQSGGMRMP